MPLQTSGAISLLDIANEFGGSTPHSINEYYGVDTNIPASGTISFNQFYGASNCVLSTTVDLTGTVGITSGTTYRASYNVAFIPIGEWNILVQQGNQQYTNGTTLTKLYATKDAGANWTDLTPSYWTTTSYVGFPKFAYNTDGDHAMLLGYQSTYGTNWGTPTGTGRIFKITDNGSSAPSVTEVVSPTDSSGNYVSAGDICYDQANDRYAIANSYSIYFWTSGSSLGGSWTTVGNASLSANVNPTQDIRPLASGAGILIKSGQSRGGASYQLSIGYSSSMVNQTSTNIPNRYLKHTGKDNNYAYVSNGGNNVVRTYYWDSANQRETYGSHTLPSNVSQTHTFQYIKTSSANMWVSAYTDTAGTYDRRILSTQSSSPFTSANWSLNGITFNGCSLRPSGSTANCTTMTPIASENSLAYDKNTNTWMFAYYWGVLDPTVIYTVSGCV